MQVEDSIPYCTCTDLKLYGYTNIGDQVWVHAACGKQSRPVWEGTLGMEDPKTYYALPPRGLSVSSCRIGPDIRKSYTFVCENTDCFAIAYGTSEDSVRFQLKDHVCPAPARRDLISSGRTAIQKMWDELDEVIDKIKNVSIETGIAEINYARGISMCIAFTAPQYFRNHEDVLRESNKRWKMRNNLLAYEPTPGYHWFPANPLEYVKKDQQSKPTTQKKAASKSAKKVAPERQFTDAERTLIRDSVHVTGLPVGDVAKMFGVDEARIMRIAGESAIKIKPIELPPLIGGLL